MNATRKVQMKIATEDGKDQTAVPVFIETNRGAGYVRTGGQDMVANGEAGNFVLNPGERLVIEGFAPEAVQYDPTQSAAYHPSAQRGNMDSATPAQAASQHPQDSRIQSSPGTTITPAMAQASEQERRNAADVSKSQDQLDAERKQREAAAAKAANTSQAKK